MENDFREKLEFHDPDVRKYWDMAENVPAGMMARIPFIAKDVASLFGLVGASFLLKPPEPAGQCTQLDVGWHWYLRGEAEAPIAYQFPYVPEYVPPACPCLVDVAILQNWFAPKPSWQARVFVRCTRLDGNDGGILAPAVLEPLRGREPNGGGDFLLFANWESTIGPETEVPLASWCPPEQPCCTGPMDDVLSEARNSPVAWVLYARFTGPIGTADA